MTPAVPIPMPDWKFWMFFWLSILAFALVIQTVHVLPPIAKRITFAIIAFFCGFFYLCTFFLPKESALLFGWSRDAAGKPTNWFSGNEANLGVWVEVIVAFTFALGVVNLVMVHGRNIARWRSGWHNSVALLGAMVGMMFFGIAHYFVKTDQTDKYVLFPAFDGARLNYWYDIFFNGMYVPLEGTMFSILAFFIASAAFRAFRMRSGEATVMLISAFVIMVGQVPLGMMLTAGVPSDNSWRLLRVENMAGWILAYPNAATLRGIGFGVAVGAVAMALRVWLSLERSAIFQSGESR